MIDHIVMQQNNSATGIGVLKREGGLKIKGHFRKPSKEMPLISVVTVVLNGEIFIEETLKSVINQTYQNIEYIIVDGGSSDGTIDIIKKYEDKIDYWISEKDKGIYDAMNKGIKNATGLLIGIINAGDEYTEGAITKVVECFKSRANSNPGVITGGAKKIDKHGNSLGVIYRSQNDLMRLSDEMAINHASTFVHKYIYKTYGLFNESFRIAADFELMRRFYFQSVPFYFIDDIIAIAEEGGVSEKLGSILLLSQERAQIIFTDKTCKYFYAVYWHTLNLFLRAIIKRVLPVIITNKFKRLR